MNAEECIVVGFFVWAVILFGVALIVIELTRDD